MKAKSSFRLAAWLAIQAGFSSLAGASVMADVFGPKWSALLFSVSASFQVGTAAWIAATRPVESTPPPVEAGGYPGQAR